MKIDWHKGFTKAESQIIDFYYINFRSPMSANLALIRPVYNALSRFTPLKPLPAVGHPIQYFYLAFVRIENNDPELFRGLLRFLYNHRRTGFWHYFIAGFHETDPLLHVLHEYRRIEVAGRLYRVYYPEDEATISSRSNQIPHVEMAMI